MGSRNACEHGTYFAKLTKRYCPLCTFRKSTPRKDKRGVDLVSDALPFGRLWYGRPNAVSNAIGYAMHRSLSHHAIIRVYDDAGNVIETRTCMDCRLGFKTTGKLCRQQTIVIPGCGGFTETKGNAVVTFHLFQCRNFRIPGVSIFRNL